MFLSLKLQRNLNDTFRARRMITQASEEEIAAFRTRLGETAIRRKARGRRSRRRKKSAGAQGTSAPQA